jgi:hypothetical protein
MSKLLSRVFRPRVNRVDNDSPHEKPRLFLHAGTHKTGTTAIQAFAAKNRNILKKQGLLYPLYDNKPKPNDSHLALFHAIAGQKNRRVKPDAVPAIVDSWARQARHGNAAIFLSAEAVWRHKLNDDSSPGWYEQRRQFLERVSEVFSDFDIQIVIVLRDQDSFVGSYYREHINKNTKLTRMGFAEFCAKEQTNVLRYQNNIELFEQCFDDVTVALYPVLTKDNSLISNFFNLMEIHTKGAQSVGRVRQSLSIPQAIVKRYLCTHYGLSSEQADRALRDEKLSDVLIRTLGDCQSFWPSEAERQQFISSFAEDNAWIRERFFPARSQLFDFPSECPGYSGEIPDELDRAVQSYLGYGGTQPSLSGHRS